MQKNSCTPMKQPIVFLRNLNKTIPTITKKIYILHPQVTGKDFEGKSIDQETIKTGFG